MQRREVIQVFREICECIPDAFISTISLASNGRAKGQFALRIDVALNAKSLENVKSIVVKHGLTMKEDRGSLLIYGSETHPAGMEVVA